LEEARRVNKQGNYAFIQLAHDLPQWPEGSSLASVLPMALAIRRFSAYPLVLLTNITHLADGSDVAALRRLSVNIMPLQPVVLPERLQRSFLHRKWTLGMLKLQIWRFTQYDKLIWLDSDTMLFRPIDWLFQLNGTWAQRDSWTCRSTEEPSMCSGVMLVSPSEDTYNGMLKFAESLSKLPEGDQRLIDLYHKEVAKEPVQLFNFSVVDYGFCVGVRKVPALRGPEGLGEIAIPAVVHKFSERNECFTVKFWHQMFSLGTGVRTNLCQYNPLGPHWRDLFCTAAELVGYQERNSSLFCRDSIWYR